MITSKSCRVCRWQDRRRSYLALLQKNPCSFFRVLLSSSLCSGYARSDDRYCADLQLRYLHLGIERIVCEYIGSSFTVVHGDEDCAFHQVIRKLDDSRIAQSPFSFSVSTK